MRKTYIVKLYVIFLSLMCLTSMTPNFEIVSQVSGQPNSSVNLGFVTKFGNSGQGEGEFSFPIAIAMNATHIFVSDTWNYRIQIFDLAGNFVDQFGSYGSGDGQLNHSEGITVNDTHILVSDTWNARIQVFDLAGKYVQQFGSIWNPKGITMNATHIFVSEQGASRIQVFDLAGKFETYIGSFGIGSTEIQHPFDVAVNDSFVFVSDGGITGRVQVYDLAGNHIDQIGSLGSGNGQLDSPHGIVVTDDYIYVVDNQNYRVQVFDLAWNYVTKFGSSGSEDEQFGGLYGITTNETHLLIPESNYARVKILAKNFPPQLSVSPTQTTIGLNWDPPLDFVSNPVLAYRLYKGTEKGTYTFLVETDQQYYNDIDVVADREFYYAVTAVTATGESRYDEVSSHLSPIPTVTKIITQTDLQNQTVVSTKAFTENYTKTVYDIKITEITNTECGRITSTVTSTKTEETSFPIITLLILFPILTRIIRKKRKY
ncbi:MAG: 6-bladed beta-propeller [Candidatus Kariarchaeaceae archaeon]